MHITQNRVRECLFYDPATGEFRWRITRGGKAVAGALAARSGPRGYLQIMVDGSAHYAHRLAWLYVKGAIPAGMQIDHADGNRANNEISNLRLATRSQQRQNSRRNSNNSSGFKGVSFHAARGLWASRITRNKHTESLGYFDTAEAAYAAYCRAAQMQFGEFARIA
jgi:hypothetical protein